MALVHQFDTFALRSGTGTPIGNETPTSIGDVYVRRNAIGGTIFVSIGLTSADWTEAGSTSWTALSAIQWLLLDNTNPALQIGSTGLLNLLAFSTVNGLEQITYSGPQPFRINAGGLEINVGNLVMAGSSLFYPITGGIQNPSEAFENAVVAFPFPVSRIRVQHPGGVADATTITLPARAGGWLVMDAFLRSKGATGGAITLRNLAAGAGAALTDAMVPGNANIITRATTIVEALEIPPGGSDLFFNSAAAGTPPTTCYVDVMGL